MAERAPLATLRTKLREIVAGDDTNSLAAFAEAHREDPRSGAQQLVERAHRRLNAIEKERARMDALFALRRTLFASGYERVAGVDEVGVGPLAGPVVAAAVILPEDTTLTGLDDSKKLKREQREKLALAIREQAVSISIGCVPPPKIDDLNIYHAALEAMRLAVTGLHPAPDYCLVDARTVPQISTPQRAIVHGDAVDASIAAASIVAKVHRDAMMHELDQRYPGYGFGRHMGYGTEFHVDALRRLGPCEAHRRSFAPVAEQAARHSRRP
ncbi:MAG: ribonuclease HII [Myxococcota bacterium]|jgi:ribonuclease HII|nr:ribonuclease HII [Myxococcota bacterium]